MIIKHGTKIHMNELGMPMAPSELRIQSRPSRSNGKMTNMLMKHEITGWWLSPTPLKIMSSSVGMMKFPIYGKIMKNPKCSKPPTSKYWPWKKKHWYAWTGLTFSQGTCTAQYLELRSCERREPWGGFRWPSSYSKCTSKLNNSPATWAIHSPTYEANQHM